MATPWPIKRITADFSNLKISVLKALRSNSSSDQGERVVVQGSRALFSQQVCELIIENHATDKESSFIFGLSGKWGVGKTTFLKRMKEDLETHDGFVVTTISPWKFGSEHLTFLRNFLRILDNEANTLILRNWSIAKLIKSKLSQSQLDNLDQDISSLRVRWRPLLILGVLSMLWVLYQQSAPYDWVIRINTDGRYVKQVLLALASLIAIPIINSILVFQKNNKAIDTLDRFDDLFKRILNKFPKGSKLVVFVDDLDRVSPEVSRRVLDTLITFFEHPNVSFVVTGDHSVLERHIGSQIVNSQSQAENMEEGRRYLKKIFDVYWHLPPVNNEEFVDFLSKFMNEKTILQKKVFNRKPDELGIFQQWLLNYFDKNYRNAKRFIGTVLFNFEVINQQIQNSSRANIEQFKDLKRNPLLVIRMLMIQELAAPLFDEYLRNPALVGILEYEIATNKGSELDMQIRKLDKENKITISQEQFLRQFLYEKPRFYDSERGGIIVRSIEPFLYLAASSNFSDTRGPTDDDFISMLERESHDQMLSSLVNAGSPSLSAIGKKLLPWFANLEQSNKTEFAISLSRFITVLLEIDGNNPTQGFFKDLFSNLSINTILDPTIPISQRYKSISDIWRWLDRLPNDIDFDSYFDKFQLNDIAQYDAITEFIANFSNYSHFSSRMILRWLVYGFSINPDLSIDYIHSCLSKVPLKYFNEILPIMDQIVSRAVEQPESQLGRQCWEIIKTTKLSDMLNAFDLNISEAIEKNNADASNWLARNYDEFVEIGHTSNVELQIDSIIKQSTESVDAFKGRFAFHSILMSRFAQSFWQSAMILGKGHVFEFVKALVQDPLFSSFYPQGSVAVDIYKMVYDYASSIDDDERSAQALSLLGKADFWKYLSKSPILSRLSSKARSKTKPAVSQVAIAILSSWK